MTGGRTGATGATQHRADAALPTYAPEDLAHRVLELLAEALAGRVVVGVAGQPGSGKSTLASELVAAVRAAGTTAVCVPMDGFHLAGAELARLGRQGRKGAPDTFDAAGFVHLLRRLALADETAPSETVYAPIFDRDLEEAIAGAIPVGPEVQVIVTEGNYLLLDDGPWASVRSLLTETWYLDVAEALRVDRLVARHIGHGRTPEQARAWTQGPDQANADLIAATRGRADGVVRGR